MECTLCNRAIKDYDPAFHHLKIDDAHAVDICQDCIDTFMEWQGKVIAGLFPTTAMKRRFGKKG